MKSLNVKHNSFSLLKVYFKEYKHHFIIGFISLLVVDGLQIAIPWEVRRAINILSNRESSIHSVFKIGIYIVVLAAGVGICRFIWRYYIIGISRRIEEKLRNRFYHHLATLPYSFFNTTSIGDLMAHATNDLEAVRMMCGMALVASTDAAVLMIASLTMMLKIDQTLTLYILIPLPVMTWTILKLGPKLHKRFRRVQEVFSNITQKTQETFSGIKVVKSFVQEKAEDENFKKLNHEYISVNLKLVKIWGALHPLIWSIAGACSIIILWIGGNRVIDNQMSMGDFVAFNSYLGILIWPMIAIGWVVNLYQRGRASLERLFSIFQIKSHIQDAPDAVDATLKGNLEIKNLSFSYEKENKRVLKNINIKIRSGQWLAVMGRTGSSKSSLLNLIPRFYEVPLGTIFLDGRDIRKIKLKSLREQISVVPQETFLFSDTIEDNVKFGQELDRSQLINVVRIACIYDDILTFPDRFNTIVGEKGVMLSGGQKQRVALARALAKSSKLLLLDDALSAVDSETESQILMELKKNLSDKTVILVTHRVAASQYADKIIFLENGEIVESGTHEELIRLKHRYYEIFERQRLLHEIEISDVFR